MTGMHNFSAQKQRAINQINEMQKRAIRPKNEPRPIKKAPAPTQKAPQNLPFLTNLSLNDDTLIILGLILILSSEKSDMLLILALAYILM